MLKNNFNLNSSIVDNILKYDNLELNFLFKLRLSL